MPIDYAAATAAYRKFKSALTRATNKKDWDKVIKVADAFEAFYADRGWSPPDDWARFARAKDDALYAKRRASTTW